VRGLSAKATLVDYQIAFCGALLLRHSQPIRDVYIGHLSHLGLGACEPRAWTATAHTHTRTHAATPPELRDENTAGVWLGRPETEVSPAELEESRAGCLACAVHGLCDFATLNGDEVLATLVSGAAAAGKDREARRKF
jgi:hypothetical protein